MLYHLPGVDLLWGAQTIISLDVSDCVGSAKVKQVGETAVVRGTEQHTSNSVLAAWDKAATQRDGKRLPHYDGNTVTTEQKMRPQKHEIFSPKQDNADFEQNHNTRNLWHHILDWVVWHHLYVSSTKVSSLSFSRYMVTNTNTLQDTTNNTQIHVRQCTPADAHAHIYPHHTHVSHTVLLTRDGLSVRRTHREVCWHSVCRPYSAHWTGRMNCRKQGKELAHTHTHRNIHMHDKALGFASCFVSNEIPAPQAINRVKHS